MSAKCPYCSLSPKHPPENRNTKHSGYYRRRSDSKLVQRFSCLNCQRSFSSATWNACYRQKKRRLNDKIRRALASGVSQRRLALEFHCSRTTVVRKFLFVAQRAQDELQRFNQIHAPAKEIEFDDLITIEHTKLKPLSCTLAIEAPTRRILGLMVAQIPASGRLAEISKKKYGPRKDQARKQRLQLMRSIQTLATKDALIRTDEWPQYPPVIKTVWPEARHEAYPSKRAAVAGQGELKTKSFDPIFAINHTLAMFRANINRLFRKTWCTTKKPERLLAHMMIYAHYHNTELITLPKASSA